MKICMMTNTYLPHVGGVARSVSTFAEEYLRLGHDVLVVAPTFDGDPLPEKSEAFVERVAALQNFNGSDFSVRLPLAAALSDRLDAFKADIIHAHHPFLLGDSALRVAMNKNVPIVFTHHTRYEDYTHYMPFESEALKEVAKTLPTHFANLCDGVIAPSESIARLLRRRGVKSPISVVPTGIDVEGFASANGVHFREKFKIPKSAIVIGHVGRLAAEKNMPFLFEGVAAAMKQAPETWFLVVGDGPEKAMLTEVLTRDNLQDRLVMAGKQTGRALQSAYRAMDFFAFASTSETQGMVVAEAMAAHLPVVALNAPGVREVVTDGENGFLLPPKASSEEFAAALVRLAVDPAQREILAKAASATAQKYSRERSARRALAFYDKVRRLTRRERILNHLDPWSTIVHRIGLEWDLLSTRTQTIAAAVFSDRKAKAS